MAFSNEVKVGIFTTVILAMLIASTFYMGGITLFRSGYSVNVLFDSTPDLKANAGVKYGGGVKIGKVQRIFLTEDKKINVELQIDKGTQINNDVYISVITSGVMGEKFVNIAGGTKEAPFIKAGDTLAGKSGGGIDAAMESINSVSAEFKDILNSLNKIVTGVDKSLVGSVDNVNELTKTTKEIVSKNSPAITKSVQNFEKASADMASATSNLKQLTGQLNKLLKDIDKSNVSETMLNLNKISSKLEETVTALDSAAKKIESGDGTLSVLINDKKMAEDLKAVVKDIKENPWKILWKK
ncbi:MAG: MlaD family protein [Candidatus Firestonebacteria bacterium]